MTHYYYLLTTGEKLGDRKQAKQKLGHANFNKLLSLRLISWYNK